MGTIASTGIGSGLDISSLVSQLVAAEGQPQAVRLDQEEARLQGKLSALGSLRSALSTFQSSLEKLQDIDSFRGRQVALDSEDFIAVIPTATALRGTYSIEVEQLASAQRLATADPPFASPDAVLGTGDLTFTIGGSGFSVTIDETNNTLAGIRDAINDAPTNTGLSATIVTGVDGSRLVLRADASGAANAVTVTTTGGDGGLLPLVYDPSGGTTNLVELEPAQDASVLIDGLRAQSATNTISEAIAGVDIDLLAVNEAGVTTTFSIDFDQTGAEEAVANLVESYNTLLDTIRPLSAFDPESQIAAPLLGDSTLRNVTLQLRRELNNTINSNGPFTSLFDLGISTNVEGQLELDTTKLKAALDTDIDGVADFFANETFGLAGAIDGIIEPLLQSGGILESRTDGINSSITDIGERREALGLRLESLEARLLRQFNALDSLLSQLNSTSGFLTQQLSNLPGSAPVNNN